MFTKSIGLEQRLSTRWLNNRDALDLPPVVFDPAVIAVTQAGGVLTAGKQVVSLLDLNGWQLNVMKPPSPSANTITHATTLATQLSRMSDFDLVVADNGAGHGIKVGTYAEWSNPAFATTTYDYTVYSKSGDLWILGKDGPTLEKAVWRVLHELGYRYFFATSTWEYVPHYDTITISVAVEKSSTYLGLFGVGLGGGTMAYAATGIDAWRTRNRVNTTKSVQTGHSYAAMIAENQAAFNAHPEYWSASGNKLCVNEPAVKAFALTHSETRARASTNNIVVSLTAADGSSGWTDVCSGTNEQATLTPSDRQLSLAKYVQTQMDLQPLDNSARVGILAYADTARPPTILGSNRLVVVVTDGFYPDGMTFEDVIEGYQAAGITTFAPYFYYSVWTWDYNAPGVSQLSSKAKLKSYVDKLALLSGSDLQFVSGEGSDSWGPDGLGYYTLARLMTDAPQGNVNAWIDSIREDFYVKAFGAAYVPMKSFYQLISSDVNKPLLSTDLISRMYSYLQFALTCNINAAEKARIYDLVVYTRYVELLYKFNTADPAVDSLKPLAYEEMAAWVYRTKFTQMVNYRMLFSDTNYQTYNDGLATKYGIVINPTALLTTAPGTWTTADVTDSEVTDIISNGISNNAQYPFTPVGYDGIDLVKIQNWQSDNRARGSFSNILRDCVFDLVLEPGQTSFDFSIRSGLSFTFFASTSLKVLDGLDSSILHNLVIPPDKLVYDYSLSLIGGKRYYIVCTDRNGYDIDWTNQYGVSRQFDSSKVPLIATYKGYFYVPKGVTTIGGFVHSKGARFIKPDGTVALTTVVADSVFSCPVGSNDGAVWCVDRTVGQLTFLTVPNMWALSPRELLIPRDVALADGLTVLN